MLNKNEYGIVLYSPDFDEDISSATSVTMILEPQIGEKLEKTATVGSSSITDGDQSLTANQYLEYTTADGDIKYAGKWRLKGVAVMSATRKIYTNYKHFKVGA